ncbi:hypothetical protein ACWD4T_00700 [Streptomyces umbrinus]
MKPPNGQIVDCTDADPRVMLAQLAGRARLLVELDVLTEQIAVLQLGQPYTGPSEVTLERQRAAAALSELAALHADDDLGDETEVAGLLDSVDSAATLVRTIQEATL